MPQYDNWFTAPTRTGMPLRRFRCGDCGYGATRRTEPARCPMCGGGVWAEEPWEARDSFLRDLGPTLQPMTREAAVLGFLPGVPLS
jgi:hypothetical protein